MAKKRGKAESKSYRGVGRFRLSPAPGGGWNLYVRRADGQEIKGLASTKTEARRAAIAVLRRSNPVRSKAEAMRAMGAHGGKRKAKTKTKRKNKAKAKPRKRKNKACPRGQIRRKAYTRRTKTGKTIKIPSRCIKDVGLPGKGPRLIKVGAEGKGLRARGYSTKKSAASRRAAISKMVRAKGYVKTMRHLNARANLQGGRAPGKAMRADVNWMKEKWGKAWAARPKPKRRKKAAPRRKAANRHRPRHRNPESFWAPSESSQAWGAASEAAAYSVNPPIMHPRMLNQNQWGPPAQWPPLENPYHERTAARIADELEATFGPYARIPAFDAAYEALMVGGSWIDARRAAEHAAMRARYAYGNPVGYPLSGRKYYRPAMKVGEEKVRVRIPLEDVPPDYVPVYPGHSTSRGSARRRLSAKARRMGLVPPKAKRKRRRKAANPMGALLAVVGDD